MILVDTSVWIQHFRQNHKQLNFLLLNERVVMHEFVLGELACGSIKNRQTTLSLLTDLPKVETCENADVLKLIEVRRLYNSGLGWVDMHILCSAILSDTPVWSLDKNLRELATKLHVGYLA